MRADTESPATLGAVFVLSGVECTVWAPGCRSVGVKDVATGEVFALRPATEMVDNGSSTANDNNGW